MRVTCLAVMATMAQVAHACSGPGAQSAMAASKAHGWMGFGAQAILSVLMLSRYLAVRRGPGHPLVLLLLLGLHPTWYVSAYRGDCGSGLDMLSIMALILHLALFSWQLSFVKGK